MNETAIGTASATASGIATGTATRTATAHAITLRTTHKGAAARPTANTMYGIAIVTVLVMATRTAVPTTIVGRM